MTPDTPAVDVAVAGAGPAGLAAALAAAGCGCSVALIDSAPAVGGQIYRQSIAYARTVSNSLHPSLRLAPALRPVIGHPRIQHLPATTIWHASRASGCFLLHVTSPRTGGGGMEDSGPARSGLAGGDPARSGMAGGEPAGGQVVAGVVRARAVVVATGASELVLPFPGWDLPGVTTAGAAQALLKSQGVTMGNRVIVAGSGPLLLPVAAGLAAAGVRVLAVLEATRAMAGLGRAALTHAGDLIVSPGKLREAAGYAAILARHRVPVRTGHAVIACHGDRRVRRATVARLDGQWRPVPGSRRELAVDAVHVSYGFSPALELARLLGCADTPHPARPFAAVTHDADQATSVAGVFAAGEVTGVGGAQVAEQEGYLAGASAARYLGKLDAAAHTARTAAIRPRLGRARRFAELLDAAYPLRPGWLGWPEPDTVVCRCEDVPWASIGRAVAAGARDVRAVKGVTRCGMGYCQGRICGPVLQCAVAAAAGRPVADVGDLQGRPVIDPVPLDVIADGG
jgi:D-hydroxyproline dehydrogenase subunit alpha